MKIEVDARVQHPGGFTLDVSLRCEAEALGVVGPSGSGKTSLLESIAGIEPGARVVLDGTDWSSAPLHRRDLGYVTQDALLFPHLSVRANLSYSPRASALGDVPKALGIEHLLDRMPRHLSGGERRRVALARAILSRPRVLLLDEPFAGLDESRRRDALSLLDHVRNTYRIPVILVSHLADEVIGLTDWSVRLDEGRVVAAGPSVSVLRSSDTRIDNYFTGTVIGPNRVRVGPWELSVLLSKSQIGDVRLACYAHDILLAAEVPTGISARNCLPARVASLLPAGSAVLVTLESPRLRVLVTDEAVASLGLTPGSSVVAIIKATSIAVLGAP
jgi:molybdate transport system ATP-binding protein